MGSVILDDPSQLINRYSTLAAFDPFNICISLYALGP